ncbi:Acg family FMN-binding oxidoreductase [Actinophytocola sp. NPDC049390]|uniref:Acg family FMN-binding oxidoreductase n=1 Tax=Actinophytocola sp. NPDC049390 TaxID=3363894 RepID=UPI0037B981A5
MSRSAPTWTSGERGLVRLVAELAPSVHNTLPWRIVCADGARTLSLLARGDRALPQHDPHGRDRLISCGAALTNVRLALCALGWVPEIDLLPMPVTPGEVARVVVVERGEPIDEDVVRYLAVSYRRSHRAPFLETPVDDATVRRLAAHGVDGVEIRRLGGRYDAAVLAKLLSHSAAVLRLDTVYQRELNAWTANDEHPVAGAGVAVLPRRDAALPWAGLVRRSTAIPDRVILTDRLARECLLLVETPDDGPLDHLRAGMAVEEMWLTAVGAGLACAVLTQPLQVPEVRAGLVEELSLNGFPQVLCRLGYPIA